MIVMPKIICSHKDYTHQFMKDHHFIIHCYLTLLTYYSERVVLYYLLNLKLNDICPAKITLHLNSNFH